MDNQTREARKQTKELSFNEKMENFWYYNKTKIVIGVVFLVVAITTMIEFTNMTEYDMTVSYYSTTPISDEGVEAVKDILRNEIIDINDNVTVDLSIIPTYADLESVDEQTKAVLMKLQAELAAGNSTGYLLDEDYKNILEKNFSDTIEKVLDITEVDEITEKLGLNNDEKLYWVTRQVYLEEQQDEQKLKEHENALRIQKFLEGLASK